MVQLSCIPKLESHQLSFRSDELEEISGTDEITDPEESVSSQKPICLPSTNHQTKKLVLAYSRTTYTDRVKLSRWNLHEWKQHKTTDPGLTELVQGATARIEMINVIDPTGIILAHSSSPSSSNAHTIVIESHQHLCGDHHPRRCFPDATKHDKNAFTAMITLQQANLNLQLVSQTDETDKTERSKHNKLSGCLQVNCTPRCSMIPTSPCTTATSNVRISPPTLPIPYSKNRNKKSSTLMQTEACRSVSNLGKDKTTISSRRLIV